MQLAMYRGPATELMHKIGHEATCLITNSIYSHCELVIDGKCWSSSMRDKGVRGKVIELDSGHWDVFRMKRLYAGVSFTRFALAWFEAHEGDPYDWRGCARFVVPFLPQRRSAFFCSEAVAAALGLARPELFSPQSLLDHLTSGGLVERAVKRFSSQEQQVHQH